MLSTTDFEKPLSLYKTEGIECSATYHTIIQTCRMMGIEVLKYFQAFFRKFDEGCRDFHEMILGQLTID